MTAARRPPCILLAEEVWGTTLHAMRSLDSIGVPVLVASSGEGSTVYRRSRHCSSAIDLDTTDPERGCSELREWAESLHPGPDQPLVILPLSDRLVEVLHQQRSSFGPRYRLAIPEPSVTEPLLDKTRSFRVAEDAGLSVPRWLTLDRTDDLSALATLEPPVIIRPTSWATTGERYFKLLVARDRSTAERDCRNALEAGAELVVQRYLEADDSAVEFAILWRSSDGERTAICTGRKRRQSTTDGGVMVWGETTTAPDVAQAAAAFLDCSRFTGLGGIEFIRVGDDLHFIEFNPRLEAIHFLAAAAGIDTVLMAYEDLALGSVPPWIPSQKPATAWLGTAWLSRLFEDPSTWRTAIRDRIDFRSSPQKVRAIWDPHDPGPGLAVTARLAARGLRSATRRRR